MKSLSPLLYSFIALCSSCALAPIGSHYERAGTLEKNQLEVSGNFEKYDGIVNGDVDEVNYNYGGTIGYGICEKFDVKFRYARMNEFEDETLGRGPIRQNFFSLSPKYMIIDEVFSVKLPMNLYHSSSAESAVFAVAPGLLGTWPVSNSFDVTMGTQYQIPFDEGFDPFFGLSLGFGASTDLDVWAIRPEIGWQTSFSSEQNGSYINYGLAFIYNFSFK